MIFLPDIWTVLLCFIAWPLLQFAAALACLKLPDRTFSSHSFIFRTHHCENGGLIYDRIFRVSRWKHLVPDGHIVSKKRQFKKKHLETFSADNLNKFILESARAELTHWLAIPPFVLFGFFVPSNALWCMLIYTLAVNLPCIIIQRYNRPRLQGLLDRMNRNYRTAKGTENITM